MTDITLARARAGDGPAFADLTDRHRRELLVHCYRILGSVQDAEDVLQETLLAAWSGLDGFEQRASLRTWLYRIATNRCLNVLRDRRRRPLDADHDVPPGFPAPTRRGEPVWLQPLPDALIEGVADDAPGPEARYERKEAVGLALVTGLQRLPAQQRAVLVLRDVLGYRAAEVAEMLDTTVASVTSALQRARQTLDAQPERAVGGALPSSTAEREVVGRFSDAFERGDVDGVVDVLTDDAWLRMPPATLEYQGRAAIHAFLSTTCGPAGGPVRVRATRANGQPAVAYYRADADAGVYRAAGLIVLTLGEAGVVALTRFGDVELLPRFGLPATLPAAAA